jgi:hypothetical protein
MSLLTVEVEIDHGKLTTASPELLPERGRGVLTVVPGGVPGGRAVSIGTGRDGLPLIQGEGGVITSALVREIEDLTL